MMKYNHKLKKFLKKNLIQNRSGEERKKRRSGEEKKKKNRRKFGW